MSGIEIVGLVAAAVQFTAFITKTVTFIKNNKDAGKAHHQDLIKLGLKLDLFENTLQSFKNTAEKFESSKYQTERRSWILKKFQKNIQESEKAIHSLFTCRGKYSKPKNRSTLQLVIDHWLFDRNGKEEVQDGIYQVEIHMKKTKNLLEEAKDDMRVDIYDAVHDIKFQAPIEPLLPPPYPLERMSSDSSTLSNASTASNDSNSSSDSNTSNSSAITKFSDYGITTPTKTPTKVLQYEWDLDLDLSEKSRLQIELIAAIEKKKEYKLVRKLLNSEGQDPLAKDDSGWCVFHYAVRGGSKTVMRELLDTKKLKEQRGFDMRDIHGDTALHFASSLGSRTMAKELLAAGCAKDLVNLAGCSPLAVAVERKHLAVIEVLLKCDAECIPENPESLRKIRNEIKYLQSK